MHLQAELIEEAMEEGRTIYRDSAPGRLKQITDHLDGWMRGDAEASGEIARVAHTMRGGAAVLGLEKAAVAAKALEAATQDLDPVVRARVPALIEKLRAAIAGEG